MPRRGENIYKRKDGRWEGRYIRGRTPAGKAEYGYVYAKSYAACREKRRRMEDALPQKPMLTGEMSVCQAAEFFLSERRSTLKTSTIGRYEYMIRHYIVPELGTLLLRDLTAEKLSAYFKSLQDKGLSSKTARDIGVLLKTIFKVAKKKCHCDCPGRDVELPAYHGKKIEVFSDHEIALLAQKILETPDITGLCILLVLNTGLRLGEICALRWSDIDLDAGVISINRTVQNIAGRGTVFTAPKTKRSRRCIKIGPECVQLLREYRQHQRAERLRMGTAWVRRVEIAGKMVENDLLFTKWNGAPIDPKTVTTWFPGFLAAHDLPPVHFHSLRHTNASLLIAAHVPVTAVSGRLGHAKTSTTTDIYAGFIRSADAAASDALTDVFIRIRDENHA